MVNLTAYTLCYRVTIYLKKKSIRYLTVFKLLVNCRAANSFSYNKNLCFSLPKKKKQNQTLLIK